MRTIYLFTSFRSASLLTPLVIPKLSSMLT
jgi:hypothetical protein